MNHEERARVGLDDAAQLGILAELFHAHLLMVPTATGAFERIPVSPQMLVRDEETGKPVAVRFCGKEYDMSHVVPDVATRARAAKAVMDVTGSGAAHRLKERVTDAEMEVRRGAKGSDAAPRVTMNFPPRARISTEAK